uniref:Uncharacterized protein n=1 Tax=Marseillevirus LCMAC201 TaxID=2506605 RepID=A0A481YXS8_9VIRU|nr:MAG: hypothetical protein LCMAC201_05280 [Marseillevirus LCMAC201]
MDFGPVVRSDSLQVQSKAPNIFEQKLTFQVGVLNIQRCKVYLIILMEDIDWEKLEQQEEFEIEGGDDTFLTAYDEYNLSQSDDETQKWDYDDEPEGEFNQFVDQDPEFGFSYTQLEHVSFADPELGTTIGGKFTKLEKIMQMQTVSKEKLYINKLKFDLSTYFSFDNTNHYATLVQAIPRFWLKNSAAIASTIFMIDKLGSAKLTVAKLNDYSIQTGIRKEDLFRYYRLLGKYIK